MDSSAGAITGLLGRGTEHTSYGPQVLHGDFCLTLYGIHAPVLFFSVHLWPSRDAHIFRAVAEGGLGNRPSHQTRQPPMTATARSPLAEAEWTCCLTLPGHSYSEGALPTLS